MIRRVNHSLVENHAFGHNLNGANLNLTPLCRLDIYHQHCSHDCLNQIGLLSNSMHLLYMNPVTENTILTSLLRKRRPKACGS